MESSYLRALQIGKKGSSKDMLIDRLFILIDIHTYNKTFLSSIIIQISD